MVAGRVYTNKMAIHYHLNMVNAYLMKKLQHHTLVVGQTESGAWLIGDDDLEVSALVVVRWMLKHKYKKIGNLELLINGLNYQLVLTS